MTSAIIVAAGKGARMGPNVDKLFFEVAGRPVIAHTWQRFDDSARIDEVVLVVRDTMQPAFAELADRYGFRKSHRLVIGGKQRQDSGWNGFQALSPRGVMLAIQGRPPPFTFATLLAGTTAAARGSAACGAART